MQLSGDATVSADCLVVARSSAEYQDESDKYRQVQSNRDFSRQYFHVYAARLTALRARLEEAAREKWGVLLPMMSVHELEEQTGDCVIIGTLFKQQQLKPSILKEISEEHNLMPQPPRERFISDVDELLLEDDRARVRLVGDIDPQQYVTGIVCAVRGQEEVSGKFTVKDICFPDVPANPRSRVPPEEDIFVLLVSGLGLTRSGADLFHTQLIADLVSGQLGSPDLQRLMAKITRVIIAGNSLSSASKDKDFLKRAAYLNTDFLARSAEAVRSLDDVISQLTATCEVDLMPGEFDPTNHLLPQRPLHRCLLPKSARFRTFHGVTNPYQAVIGGRRVLGTSGQNVHDLYRYSACEDALVLLERLLTWGHLCPTAPDTLSCYPYYDKDPFIMDSTPDVLFAGNQKKFNTKLITDDSGRSVLLLCLPEFHRTASCALVNLRSLEVTEVKLGSVMSPIASGSPNQPEK